MKKPLALGKEAVVAIFGGTVVAYAVVLVVGPWACAPFFGRALAVLATAAGWMAVLAVWSDEGQKGGRLLPRVLLATLSTALAVGAWYALAFLALPLGA